MVIVSSFSETRREICLPSTGLDVCKCIGFSDAFHDGHRHALQCVASEKRQWTKSRMGYRSGSAGAMGICRWADGGQRVDVPNTRVFLLNSEQHDCRSLAMPHLSSAGGSLMVVLAI